MILPSKLAIVHELRRRQHRVAQPRTFDMRDLNGRAACAEHVEIRRMGRVLVNEEQVVRPLRRGLDCRSRSSALPG